MGSEESVAERSIVTEDFDARVRKLRDHGRISKYEHDELGWGYRLDALQAEPHTLARLVDPQHFDLDLLARESEGYVGAEIEQTVIDAMYLSFNEDMRRVTTADILACIRKQVPLSISQRETVAALRAYLAEGRAVSASRPATRPEIPAGQKTIALETFDPVRT